MNQIFGVFNVAPFSHFIAPGAPDFLRSPISIPRFYFYAACAPGCGGVGCGSGWGGAEGWDGAGDWCAFVYVCALPRRANLLLACLLACLLRFVLSPSQAQDGRGLRLLLNHMLKYMSDNRTT